MAEVEIASTWVMDRHDLMVLKIESGQDRMFCLPLVGRGFCAAYDDMDFL